MRAPEGWREDARHVVVCEAEPEGRLHPAQLGGDCARQLRAKEGEEPMCVFQDSSGRTRAENYDLGSVEGRFAEPDDLLGARQLRRREGLDIWINSGVCQLLGSEGRLSNTCMRMNA